MMKRHVHMIAWVVVVILVGAWLSVSAQDTTSPPKNEGQRDALITMLCHMSSQLRLVRPLATYAILSPVRSDQRVYAQYIINILEGSHGKDYVALPVRADLVQMMKVWGISAGDPGLIEGMRQFEEMIKKIPRDSPFSVSHDRIAYAAKNISSLLDTALNETRASLHARSIDNASDHMRLSYACAFAALGAVGEGTSPGSVIDLLILIKGSALCRE